MPRYTFVNDKTGREVTEDLKISERDEFLKENPDWRQVIRAPTPAIPQSRLMGNMKRLDTDFANKLNSVNKYYGNPKRYK